MTRRNVDASIPAAASRAQRKAELIAAIERQRIDLLVEAERWKHGTLGLNAGWQQLESLKPFIKHYRGAAYLAGGALLVAGLRHPRMLVRLTRQIAAGALLLHRARHLLERVR
ncbi:MULTISPECIES: YqjK family protein [Halomonadaceae]|uniref:YqjK-like protein n=2 Tax=Billgrantia TaxID=3137761 RepID=A0ABS9ATB6_9GAMM|nr:YqjK family protein [Halomonas sp. KM-1]MCE8001385.1 hypothetical protein [Halomonas ethanolica]MCE8025005.1 hypothetical protein [Halomonas aerodenitrificans]MCE8036996.1 hypothetical protein [Halomonas sp. MCCC 1A11062]